jgi:hypothetical protein
MESTAPAMTTEETSGPSGWSLSPLVISLIVIGAIGLTGNAFVVVVMLWSKNMRKNITATYLINQSVIDALASLFLVLQLLLTSRAGKDFGTFKDELYCRLWISRDFLWSLFMTSSINLIAITLERLVATWKPLWHRVSLTRAKQMASVVIIWIPGFVLALWHGYDGAGVDGGACYAYGKGGSFNHVLGYVNICVEFILPVTIFVVSYGKIAWTLHSKPDTLKNAAPEQRKKSKDVIKVCLLLTSCFLVCWTPNAVYYFMSLSGHFASLSSPGYILSILLVNLNCCCNPFVYIFKFRAFQKATKNIFCRTRVAPLDTAQTSSRENPNTAPGTSRD